jgi:hypothetical protein
MLRNPDSSVVHRYTDWSIMIHDTIIHALLKGGRERHNKVGLTSSSMTFIPNWLQWFKMTDEKVNEFVAPASPVAKLISA